MKKVNLQFRAKMPGNKWFYQGRQHLPSFLRRVLVLLEVSHPTYLPKDLEDYLQINVDGEWAQCEFKPANKE
jgi:hypothetical protein